jgi:hypothetical protein
VFGQRSGHDRRCRVGDHCRPAATSAPRAAHAAATPCAMPLAAPGCWHRTRNRCAAATSSRCCCQPTAADQPPPLLHTPHMQPPPVHLTASLSVRRRSRSLLFPQLPSSSCHSVRPRHRHLSLATVNHRLWCSSGPIDPTHSVTRARRCSPTSPTEPATAG